MKGRLLVNVDFHMYCRAVAVCFALVSEQSWSPIHPNKAVGLFGVDRGP